MKLRKQVEWNYLTVAFAIPAVCMLFVMLVGGYEPFGQYSMLYSDMYHQYYPFFVAFRQTLRNGESLLYTWSVGMGMDYLGLIAYYLASPLNLVSVILPESWTLEYFSLLVPIKLGLAGSFFAIFLKELFGKDDPSIAVFGGFYGLCAWALGFQWNVMWLDTFALLPLVTLGTVRLVKEKRVVLYTVTLFFSIAANYYVGFFTCIFVFFLFFVLQICCWGGWKKFFLDLCRIGFFSALAIGMTAFLTLPAFGALQTTQSSVNKFPTGFRLNIASSHDLKGLLDAMRQVAGNMGGAQEPNFKEGLPNVYCGIVSIFLMFLYLLAGDVKPREKVCAVFLLVFFNVSFIIRQLDYIWHGFHFTNMIPYRFSFLYSFVVLYMAYRAWTQRRRFKLWQVLLAGVLAGGILACSNDLTETKFVNLGSNGYQVPVYLIYNSIFLVLYVGCFAYGSIRSRVPETATEEEQLRLRSKMARRRYSATTVLLAVMGVELIANVVSFGLYFPGTNVANYPKGTQNTASVIRYMKEKEQRTLFYRAETTHSQTLNDGALNGYHGVSTFTSSANVKTTLFMQALGYGAKDTYNRYLFEESSPVSNLFLGLKYMIERDGKDKTSSVFTEANKFKDTVLLRNEAYLPLGFLAGPKLADLNFDGSVQAFQFQNQLFEAATGISGAFGRLGGMEVSGNGVEVTSFDDSGRCSYQNAAANSELTYTYQVTSDGFACIHLDLPKRNTYYVLVNGNELYSETISLPQMLAVGDVEAGDTISVRIICKEGENSTATVTAAVLDMETFWRGYEVLNASTLELTKFESTYVEGTISCDRDGLLYTSIPQNGNWTAKVDGKDAKIKLVGDCMVALPLTKGEHTVSFTYENQAFAWGWKISVMCVAVFLAFAWKQGNRKPGKYQR